MASYQPFTCTRVAPISLSTLNTALKIVEPTIGAALLSPSLTSGPVTLKKNTPWTAPEIAAAQIVLDTATEPSTQLAAQLRIDAFPIEYKALVLALIDQLNTIRAALPSPLPPITPAQAIAAIRTKAGTL